MTSNEPIDICACVDAIVASYNDAAAVIQRVKASRAAQQAPAPSRYLEETIQCAPAEILKEKERGLGRFGLAFQQGDDTTLNTLRSLNTSLKTGLLQELQRLAQTEELADFRQLVDDADSGRDQAVHTLIRLRQRCLAAETTELDTSRHSSEASIRSKDLPSPLSEPKTYHFPQHHNPWLRLHTRGHSSANSETRTASGEEDTQSGAETSHKKHSHGGSLLHFLKHHRAHSHGDRSLEQNSEVSGRIGRAATLATTDQNRSVFSLGGPDGPWWSGETRGSLQRQPSDSLHRDSTVSVDTVVGISPTNQRGRSVSTATYLRNPSLAVPTPSQDNDYLGFCKGAVRMQNGDKKAMEKRKEFNDGWSQATVYYLACSTRQCGFAAHIDVNVVMTKVFIVEAKGLSFRWPFLAKSHVMQTKTKDNSHNFQCLFCVFAGEKAEVFQGNDAYFDHVATHRGDIGAIILYKTRCINDHVANSSEEFDINLFPMSYAEVQSRRASEMLTDDIAAMHLSTYSAGKNDSVLETDEPWNKGLSDFHYRDEFERGDIG